MSNRTFATTTNSSEYKLFDTISHKTLYLVLSLSFLFLILLIALRILHEYRNDYAPVPDEESLMREHRSNERTSLLLKSMELSSRSGSPRDPPSGDDLLGEAYTEGKGDSRVASRYDLKSDASSLNGSFKFASSSTGDGAGGRRMSKTTFGSTEAVFDSTESQTNSTHRKRDLHKHQQQYLHQQTVPIPIGNRNQDSQMNGYGTLTPSFNLSHHAKSYQQSHHATIDDDNNSSTSGVKDGNRAFWRAWWKGQIPKGMRRKQAEEEGGEEEEEAKYRYYNRGYGCKEERRVMFPGWNSPC